MKNRGEFMYNKEELLAVGYDFYNEHLLDGQNQDIKYYERQIKEKKPKSLLIVGAGTGRVALPLNNYVNVEALDINSERLDILKNHNPKINCYVMDICKEIPSKKYDMVIFPYNTIQLLGNRKNIKTVLINCNKLLNVSGLLIFDVSESFNTKTNITKKLLFKDYSKTVKSNIFVYCESKRYKKYIKFNTEYYIEKYDTTINEEEKYLYYDEQKLKDLVNEVMILDKIDNGYQKDFFTHKHLFHCKRK